MGTAGTSAGATAGYRAMMAAGDVTQAAGWLGRQDDYTRAYVTVSMMKADVKRLHPLGRAERAISAISALRREIAFDRLTTAEGAVTVDAIQRRQADEILSDLAMSEARNALIAAEKPGWAKVRAPIDTGIYARELAAVSPELHRALADRYATAKVLRADVVAAGWPDLRRRLLAEGSAAGVADLLATGKASGFELAGRRIRRKRKPGVPAVGVEEEAE